MHQVLIEDEGGWPLGEQVEADRCVYCKKDGLSALEALPRCLCPVHPNGFIFPSPFYMPQPRQQLLRSCPLHPQGLIWEGADDGSAAALSHTLHLPLHSHGSLSTRHGTELVRKPGRAAVTNTQVPRR